METSKVQEIIEEFRTVVSGGGRIIDSLAPPLTFLILTRLADLKTASWGALIIAALLTTFRLIRGQAPGYALGGLGTVTLAILTAWLVDRAEGYFLPNLITGGLTVLLCLTSVLTGRPLVALTSHLARGWPLPWYWHRRVRPAYTEVTLAWAVYFALRLSLQWLLFRRTTGGLLGVLNILLGWPATILLLVVSYVYGTWRLQNLGGPSVEEFEQGAKPPWEGQSRGF